MKRLISVFVVTVLILSLTACGNSSEPKQDNAAQEEYVLEISQPDTMPTLPPTPIPTPPPATDKPEGMGYPEVEEAADGTEDAGMSSRYIGNDVETQQPQPTPEPAMPDEYEDHSILTPYAKDKISEAGQKFVEGCDEFGRFMGDKLGEGIDKLKEKYGNTQNGSTEPAE